MTVTEQKKAEDRFDFDVSDISSGKIVVSVAKSALPKKSKPVELTMHKQAMLQSNDALHLVTQMARKEGLADPSVKSAVIQYTNTKTGQRCRSLPEIQGENVELSLVVTLFSESLSSGMMIGDSII